MSGLPVAIVADPDALADPEGRYHAWELVYDAKVAHGRQDDGMVRRLLRVSKPYGPGRTPYREEDFERERLEHRRLVEALADDFVATGRLDTLATGGQWQQTTWDFDLERDVLDEVARRLRETLADPFLRKLLTTEDSA